MNAPHIGRTPAQRRAVIDKSVLATKLSSDVNTLRNEDHAAERLAAIRENDTSGCWADSKETRPFEWVDGVFFLTCAALVVGGLWVLRIGGVL